MPQEASERCAILEAILKSEGEVEFGGQRVHVRPFADEHRKLISREGVLWLRVSARPNKYWPNPGCRTDLRFVSGSLTSYDPKAPWEVLQIDLNELRSPAGPGIRFAQHTAVFNLPPKTAVAALPWCYRGEARKTGRGWVASIGSMTGNRSECR